MDAGAIARAANLLADARRSRTPLAKLPADCAPRALRDAYEIQSELIRLLAEPVVGWKVGATSRNAQALHGIDEPFVGPILQSDVFRSPCVLSADASTMRAVQVEFCFSLSRDFPGGRKAYTLEDIRDSVEFVMPAVEIADCRFTDWTVVGVASLVADGAKGGRIVLGTSRTIPKDFDYATHAVTLMVNGQVVESGVGANVLGDPLNSLLWLVNHHASTGVTVRAGQMISSGTCTGSYLARRGDHIIARFGWVGDVELRFGSGRTNIANEC